jgi:hypothetical protein
VFINNSDFTYNIYKNLINSFLENNYQIISVEDFFNNKYNSSKIVVLRHDIDRRISNVENIAKIDSEHQISSSFHFRAGTKRFFKPSVIEKIIDLGHTIGYHYEDLANNHGNYKKALHSFESNLAKIRELYPVTTISMHGSPLSKWDNRWLWTKYDYKKYGIIGEPFFDTNFSNVLYLSDTGRKWNNFRYNIRDRVETPFDIQSLTTSELMDKIRQGLLPCQIMLNSHTHYWTDNTLIWYRIYIWQGIKNFFKHIVIKYGLRDRYK